MNEGYYIYILTNQRKNVLYVGVTNNLIYRVYCHKSKINKGFTSRYNIDQLVYYEIYQDISDAIQREKQIKGWIRRKKNNLIDKFNSSWEDLYAALLSS